MLTEIAEIAELDGDTREYVNIGVAKTIRVAGDESR
jgi:hypothetical protein